jgi:uncharacterized SAM-binding protein YcdF (DUF218 family)
MHRWQRALRAFLYGAAALGLLWTGGLAWFVHSSLSITIDQTTTTDAIVVLTGGRLRLEAGLDLLDAGRARKLFISGVNPRVDRSELLRVAAHLPTPDPDRIVLGHAADNTFGNARETAEWMQREGYRSLRLVTSWYHMRRSLLEFERAMPEMSIIADPVFAGRTEPDPWPAWFDIALLTVGEYDKYLATLARPAAAMLWPRAGRAEAMSATVSILQPADPRR